MSRPIVAIVGRPNVGKSTLFNYIAGKKISIVDDTPGVTRDRIYAEAEWRNRKFSMIDTGGIEPFSEDEIMIQMRRQAEIAIDTADVIVFMVDIKTGVTANDKEVSIILKKSRKPVIIAINKADRLGGMPDDAYEFYNLGFENLACISSINALGIGDLLDMIYDNFPKKNSDDNDEDVIKVAIIGKPNVGKSSLVNKICGEDRVIVSDIPGTTRDAIDTYVKKGENSFVFIDTAGIRKRSKIKETLDRYSTVRSWAAIERCDVCLIMIDALEGVTEQDTKIAGYAHEEGKACIIVVNKWDAYEKETGTFEKYKKEVQEALKFIDYAPVIFISAKTGQRVNDLYETIVYVANQASIRLGTGMLNDALSEALAIHQPPSDKGRQLKIYYITQVGVKPPTFVLFMNRKDLMHFSYERYIENNFRRSFGFVGTPIKFIMREKEKEKK